ncbi:hypothetical protein PRIPAC_80930 [Pristionchus pacificus]|uniref:Uncharacterized protein n=1 Tax=Pristionchus pacificus TaxID=54126 RepID=A0A2A6CP75_PRIPA|nr:hypothetical protein PRIPAC_80930 [Pristionchus pacificus]|eukprot:PDM80002.1 hypothetical protein PRIPAC_32581 [Pristionchus pacificus]
MDMKEAINATEFSKIHYAAVQSFEILIASVCLVSMLPCLFVIAKTGTLHWNCKALLMWSAVVQLQIITMQLIVILYDFYTGIHLPDDVGDEKWFMFAHEVGYGMSTVASVYLVVERFVALWNVSIYSDTVASSSSIIIHIVLAVHNSHVFIHVHEQHYCIVIAIIMMLDTDEFGKHQIHKKQYRLMNECPLSVRYQLAEILEYARAVIPVVILSSAVKSYSLLTCILWQAGMGQYGFMRIIFFSIRSTNCVLMKTILIASHRGLKRKFWIYFSNGEPRYKTRIASRTDISIEETETYF